MFSQMDACDQKQIIKCLDSTIDNIMSDDCDKAYIIREYFSDYSSNLNANDKHNKFNIKKCKDFFRCLFALDVDQLTETTMTIHK